MEAVRLKARAHFREAAEFPLLRKPDSRVVAAVACRERTMGSCSSAEVLVWEDEKVLEIPGGNS